MRRLFRVETKPLKHRFKQSEQIRHTLLQVALKVVVSKEYIVRRRKDSKMHYYLRYKDDPTFLVSLAKGTSDLLGRLKVV